MSAGHATRTNVPRHKTKNKCQLALALNPLCRSGFPGLRSALIGYQRLVDFPPGGWLTRCVVRWGCVSSICAPATHISSESLFFCDMESCTVNSFATYHIKIVASSSTEKSYQTFPWQTCDIKTKSITASTTAGKIQSHDKKTNPKTFAPTLPTLCALSLAVFQFPDFPRFPNFQKKRQSSTNKSSRIVLTIKEVARTESYISLLLSVKQLAVKPSWLLKGMLFYHSNDNYRISSEPTTARPEAPL